MKSLAKLIGQVLVALTLTTTFVHASPAESESVQNERSTIGQRGISDEQREMLYHNDGEEQEEDVQVQEYSKRTPFYPIDYSKTTVVDVGNKGSSVILQDQSMWILRPTDGRVVQNWNDQAKESGQSLQIFITSNDNWFFDRSYNYRMINMENGEAIYCNLSQSPFKSASIWILNLDIDGSWVELTDTNGNYLLMDLCPVDRAIYADWQANDTVLIGRNLRWGSSTNPYLLINVDCMDHVRGNK